MFYVGCIAVGICSVMLILSYRLFWMSQIIRDGYAPIRVCRDVGTVYGWVRRTSILHLETTDKDRLQWFIELFSPERVVIKIEDIKEVKVVDSFVIVALKLPIRINR